MGVPPGEVLMGLLWLDTAEVQANMTVATADGYRPVITGTSRDFT